MLLSGRWYLILALFKSEDMGELDLLDIASWEVNEDDNEFMEKICDMISKGLDDSAKKQVDAIKAYYRYRPEDMGIAFLSGEIPCKYSKCRSEYDTLYQKVTEC